MQLLVIHAPDCCLSDTKMWYVKGVGGCALLIHFKTVIHKAKRDGGPCGLPLPPLRTTGDQTCYRKSSLLHSKWSVEMTS